MNRKNFLIITISLIIILSLNGCIDNKTTFEQSFSFEKNLGNWEKNGTDLSHPSNNNQTIEWDISGVNWTKSKLSQHINISPTDGNHMLIYYLDNKNDAGKIWIEKEFSLKNNTNYQVKLDFDFGTSDYGVNQWTIIAGPYSNGEKTSLPFQGKTGQGTGEPAYVWLNKNYSFEVNSGKNGEIKILIGIWGTWETPRSYFIDNVSVSFQET